MCIHYKQFMNQIRYYDDRFVLAIQFMLHASPLVFFCLTISASCGRHLAQRSGRCSCSVNGSSVGCLRITVGIMSRSVHVACSLVYICSRHNRSNQILRCPLLFYVLARCMLHESLMVPGYLFLYISTSHHQYALSTSWCLRVITFDTTTSASSPFFLL